MLCWTEEPPGLRLGRRPYVSVLCGGDRWPCLLNSPSCLCEVKLVFSLSSVPSICPGLKMEKCQACRSCVYRSDYCCSVAKLCSTLCDLMDYTGNSPGQNTEMGSHSLLQGIFPTQGSNQGLLHCRQILYQLSYQGSLLPSLGEAFMVKEKKNEKEQFRNVFLWPCFSFDFPA